MLVPLQTPIVDRKTAELAESVYNGQLDGLRRRTDRLFAILMGLQWLFGLIAAQWISPLTWSGTMSQTHPHVWAALVLGGVITSLPVALAIMRPGARSTRHVIAVGQMLWSALLIHLTGGRIETHFHVFGSLAFLAWYRDWKVLATATVVVASDHLVRSIFWPQSVYGVLTAAPWRTLEHGAWVLFEDTFLVISITHSVREMWEIATKQAELTQRNDELHIYTGELEAAQKVLQEQADRLELQAVDLQNAQERAEESNRLKSEFLANMSHEIRTPMTAILGFADMLAENATTPEQIEAAGTIQHNGEYLLEILNDILDLSKIEAGELSIEKYRCLPHQIVGDVASLMRVRAVAKNLQLEIAYDGPIPELIQTDPTALRQILVNLVGNAIKFTEKGCVRIVTGFVPDEPQCPRLRFDIVDSGIGMTGEQIAKLFRPFTQADASMSRKFGGTGLGLAISKRLAELLGGTIVVESVPGKGSTFRVTIETGALDGIRMLDRVQEASLQAPRKPQAPKQKIKIGGRVLLAEDGQHNQRFLSMFLVKAGVEVTLADNGETAVQLALAAANEGQPFDVILMDMQMPILDGYSACRKLRASGYEGPIVALTAHAMSGDREKCIEAGCDDYVTKPVDRAHLLEVVAEHVRRKPASAGT
jgi:signal transduction histidine kinase/ActR/RegA family two-component response regulator